MKILAVDDEPLALEMLSQAILDACPHAELHSFQKYKEALTFLSETPCDIAFLDIHLRGASGERSPNRQRIAIPSSTSSLSPAMTPTLATPCPFTPAGTSSSP